MVLVYILSLLTTKLLFPVNSYIFCICTAKYRDFIKYFDIQDFFCQMSSTEETDTHEEESEEEPQKYTQALSALPPRVVQQEESQVEVSASPAFQCLDEVRWIRYGFLMLLSTILQSYSWTRLN